jgi:hypothetical protein
VARKYAFNPSKVRFLLIQSHKKNRAQNMFNPYTKRYPSIQRPSVGHRLGGNFGEPRIEVGLLYVRNLLLSLPISEPDRVLLELMSIDRVI